MHRLRSRPEFSELKIVVLSGKESSEEERVVHHIGVDFYWAKPGDFTQLVYIAKLIRTVCLDEPDRQLAAAA